MIRAPVKKRAVVDRTSSGDAMGRATGAASNVENRHGKKR
jgi:hypothetical protein